MASSGKLDQSLEDIVKTRRSVPGRGRNLRRRGPATKVAAPAGGVGKKAKAGRAGPAGKIAVPAVAVPQTGESKIIVTGLPSDVTEQQIKEYFVKVVGPVKRVFLTYGQNGVSRGVSTIVFARPDAAVEAAKQLNGVKIDGRAMKIEVVMNAANVSAPIPPKSLSDRAAKPKSAANGTTKAAAKGNAKANGPVKATAGGRGRPAKRGGRNTGRGKPKTAEELDAEMVDYFDAPANGAGAPAAVPAVAAPATGGDTGMDDIM